MLNDTEALARLAARFWAKVDKTGDGGCWLWTAYTDKDGYGTFGIGQRKSRAHRVAWELLRGPIPGDLQIDHLCRVRHCVNPAHLEPVTQRENTLRSDAFTAQQARRTHCPQGHEYAGHNLMRTHDGHRACRACRNARHRRNWPRKPKG